MLLFGKFLLLSLKKLTIVYKAIIQKPKSSKDNYLNFRKARREKQLLTALKNLGTSCEMSRCFKDQNISICINDVMLPLLSHICI